MNTLKIKIYNDHGLDYRNKVLRCSLQLEKRGQTYVESESDYLKNMYSAQHLWAITIL